MTTVRLVHSELPGSNTLAVFTAERLGKNGQRKTETLADVPVIRYTGAQHARIDAAAARYDYVVLWHPIRTWASGDAIASGDYVAFPDLAQGAAQQLYDVHTDLGATSVIVGYISPVAESQGGAQ